MEWDWSAVDDFMPEFWDGVLTTLQVLALGSLISFGLGLVWAMALRARTRFITWPVALINEFIRNTPLLIQLFFFFFVLPEWDVQFSTLTTGVLAIGLHYSTYTAQVYRAGIDGVPVGQWEAATALNLPRGRTWFAVILPQAIRRVIPALGNYVISMLKDTPMLAVIGVLEMLQRARQQGAETFQFVEPITVVGVAFILIAYPASVLMRFLERRLVQQ
ncbi:ectoine/hydroxyectoine ABC transporter permease subunit EhuD [Streptomyces boncukensis]|uniref:Ectoine/hydroxyectoine ABC transporter permease subunit EhuD n=1 Tax=Streptomyces boncukensis TaxID=2711219 RepID=A0A6G4WWP2_9ACTN|nr:ectoine/hydroxyectoine ABC transporter permease subunit EhuD [Streptomyces boncukensis]NGO68881.1 ectoine/hydroxyectoine ABC transporter permease subunit EhuD [Streptomyces boncukensis]